MAASYTIIAEDEEKDCAQYEDDGAVVLINDTNKESLVVYNAHERIYPASMTKIMTALLVMESIEAGDLSLDDKITLKQTVTFDEANVGVSDLTGGCTVTIKDLLYGLLIRSYNDCAVILAQQVAGSEDVFVDMMNEKAMELGAVNTHFVNPHGLHSDNHYTTPYDLYIIFSEFIKHPMAYTIDSLSSYDFNYTDAEGNACTVNMTATNGFLSGEFNMPEGYTLGSWKSGTTTAAGNCLIIEFVKDDTGDRYIAIIANAEDRETLYNDMTSLIKSS
jgi:D-alanyl-D-alanine carboxypeptidase (penicillin-binding protein 5/6)